jgi:hypothetical protein
MRRVASLLLLAAVGCASAPVGPEPKDYCERQAKIVTTGHSMQGCISNATSFRKKTPKRYQCLAACVDKGGPLDAYNACWRLCLKIAD